MITWTTPSGSIGHFSEEIPVNFTFVATSSIASNSIDYKYTGGSFPPCINTPMFINPYSGALSGVPSSTPSDIIYEFTITAYEVDPSNTIVSSLSREFSITVTTQQPNWITPAGSIGTFIESQPLSFQFNAVPSDVTHTIQYELISGSLPTGIYTDPVKLSTSGVMSGTPAVVGQDTPSYFTVRAVEYNGSTATGYFSDRTFAATISGITPPSFITPSGLLATTQDSIYFEYQIQFVSPDPNTTATVSVASGILPPGLEISSSGFIAGYPDKPFDDSGNPTIKTYEFSLQLTSTSGIVFSTYSIVIANQDVYDNSYNIVIISRAQPALVTASTADIVVDGQAVILNNVQGITLTDKVGVEYSLVNGITLYAKKTGYPPSQFALYVDSNLTTGFNSQNGTPYVMNTGTVTPQALRKPVILNNQPLTMTISPSDIDSPFYITGSQIAQASQQTNFGFKFLGHDFSGREITYIINNTVPFGVIPDSATGWMNGTLPRVGGASRTYSFTVQSAWNVNPEVKSNQYFFTIEVVGDVNVNTAWLTSADLGSIDNTTISTKFVKAVSAQGTGLYYRLVGYQTDAEMQSITAFPVPHTSPQIYSLLSVGLQGAYVSSTSSVQQFGVDWTQNPSLISGNLNKIYTTNAVTKQVLAVGSNLNTPYALYSDDTVNWNVLQIQLNTVNSSGAWNDVTQVGSGPTTFVIVGDFGRAFVALSTGATLIKDLVWTGQTTNTTRNLNAVAGNVTRCVIVGDVGTILSAPIDGAGNIGTWTTVASPVSVNLNSVIWTGTRFVAVGDTGYIVYSSDGINWELDNSPTLNSLSFVYKATNISAPQYIFAGGDDGTLIHSLDGITWVDSGQTIARNGLRSMINYLYNGTYTYYIVGDGGTILTSDDGLAWSSPTLGDLPVNLYLANTGAIVGRVGYTQDDGSEWPDTGKVFNFRVQAYNQNSSEIFAVRDFSLTVNKYFTSPYQNLYIQAYPSLQQRSIVTELLNSTDIIPQDYLYRPEDPYFGKASVIRYEHLYGVHYSMVNDYLDSIYENTYRRQITLGQLKTAIARDTDGNVLYEVVYSEIIDNLVNNQGISIPKQITWPRYIPQLAGPWYSSTLQVLDSFTYYDPYPSYGVLRNYTNGMTSTTFMLSSVDGVKVYDELTGAGIVNKTNGTPPIVTAVDTVAKTVTVDTVQGTNLALGQLLFFNNPAYTALTNDPYSIDVLYPASLTNMRTQIAQALGQINDYRALPLWMSSKQANGNVLGYTPAWVVCYVKPGLGQATIDSINTNWQYKLNQVNFSVDRFEVDNSVCANPPTDTNADDWYIIFSQKNILPNSTT